MAKIFGLFGSMSGKVADVVMLTRGGEQIVRRYQPTVANPQTQNQVAARARLKLMSQLAAVAAPVIAIPKMGNVSSRNRFVSVNYPQSVYADNSASIPLDSIQLTKSVVGLPQLNASRSAEAIGANITPSVVALDVSRVVYALFEVQSDRKLRYVASSVVSTPGTNNTFSTTFPLLNSPVVVLAYGVRDNNENARTIFGNMKVASAATVADLIVSRILTENDITLTETRGVMVPLS